MSDPWNVTPTNKGGDFEQVPPGNHPAALVAIVDMGQQENDYNGEKKHEHRAFFVWELVSKKNKAGNNFLIGIDLTVSLHEKAKLRKWVEARLGKSIPNDVPYPISKELGQKCLLSVKEKNGYSKIDGIASIPDGITVPDPTNKPFAWALTEVKDNKIVLPPWLPYLYGKPIGEHIKDCRELRGTPAGSTYPSAATPNVPAESAAHDKVPF